MRVFKNIKIRAQLLIGFSVLFIFVITLGAVAYNQTHQLHQQTAIMYEHPLQTRKSIGALEADILKIRLAISELILSHNDQEKQSAIRQKEISIADAENQFDNLYKFYLGPVTDIDGASESFVSWRTAVDETVSLALSGEIQKAEASLHAEGALASYREQMMARIQIIDSFAEQKSSALYKSSVELSSSMNVQLLFYLSLILLISLIICYFLLQNISRPLKEISGVMIRFKNGELDARSRYDLKNEFGILSVSLNSLADTIQKNTMLSQKATAIDSVMLTSDDDRRFFRSLLGSLATETGSQMAAVFLLDSDSRTFEHFESIGLDGDVRQSFPSDRYDGEFGAALSTCKTQYIQNIPEDTRFVFQTVSGKYIPREIITIPVLSGSQVVAIISLATVTRFNPFSVELIENIMIAMSARIEGILAYQTIKAFSKTLEKQNLELDAQKNELSAQTSELMQQNSELEMQKKQLNEASRLKTVFLSNMSHELRTPLNSVIALSGVLSRRLDGKIPQEEYSYLEIIERNGKNLLSLINDVLDISRIEAGHEKIEATKFHTNILIAELVTTIQPLAGRKNIGLIHQSKGADAVIISDADKFRHILQNLIDNAVKFTSQGEVVISSYHDKNNVVIKVTDTGIGISEEHLPYIFDEFRQADDSTARRYGGTGLGLAISKKYANLLGGTISVESIPDKGSEFTLTLPMSYVAENNIVEKERTTDAKYVIRQSLSRLEPDASDKCILLVEDNESAIIQIKDLVEELGYSIHVVYDGSEALKFIDVTIPDAMILDLMMPGIDGFQVLETLRNAEPTAHIPVLILTAKHITKEELKFLKRNNVHQLIQKGDVDRSKLQNSITGMLFPAAAVSADAAPEEADQKQTRQTKQIKHQILEGKPAVLVVEDNPDNMITVRALLSDHFTMLEAIDAHEAISMAKKHVPNLILMDIALSGMDGIQAFREIRSMPDLQHIPIIALTASAMLHDRETILSHGFDAFIAKPIIAKEFFKIINEVLYGK